MSKIINPHHLVDLKNSGLSDETITDAGIFSATEKQVGNVIIVSLGLSQELSGLFFSCYPL